MNMNRRQWLGVAGISPFLSVASITNHSAPALIAITLDLEMSRNFPTWETTHWDYEKGNLNEETKAYTLEAARRVKQAGGKIHTFLVGRALEQADVRWLKTLVGEGHRIGNHTYDHVNVTAQSREDLQFRFQRAPWLARDLSVEQLIQENIELTTSALKTRVGIQPAGFRTPGGFPDGLRNQPKIRAMLKSLGFSWVSSLYPPHPPATPNREPTPEYLGALVKAHAGAQPFRYPDGLLEIPMSPISDIGAFRTGRWKLDWFLQAIRHCVDWSCNHGSVFDFLCHPSCLYVVDPHFRAIDLICDLVNQSANKAKFADLEDIADKFRE